ncbi:MAG TPA: hypothetical protein VN516_03135 [Candidatus Baltobacteraceae bacterium]|nr:hypothetical protein [Candidatus Baltobacteraceae bacterium]
MGAELAIGYNDGAQTATPFQKHFRARRKRGVHPITGRAFLLTAKADALNIKFHSDQGIQIRAFSDDIAAQNGGFFVAYA